MFLKSLSLALAVAYAPFGLALSTQQARTLLKVDVQASDEQTNRRAIEECYARVTEPLDYPAETQADVLGQIRLILQARRTLLHRREVLIPAPWSPELNPFLTENQNLFFRQFTVVGSEQILLAGGWAWLRRTHLGLGRSADPRAGRVLRLATLSAFLSVLEAYDHPEDYGLPPEQPNSRVNEALHPEWAPGKLISNLIAWQLTRVSLSPRVGRERAEAAEFYRRLYVTFDMPRPSPAIRAILSVMGNFHGCIASLER